MCVQVLVAGRAGGRASLFGGSVAGEAAQAACVCTPSMLCGAHASVFFLQERMKVRHKEGFRPPQRGKRTDVAGDEVKLRCVGARGALPGACWRHAESLAGACSAVLCSSEICPPIVCCLPACAAAACCLACHPTLLAPTGVPLPCSLWQRVSAFFEPSVPGSTLVNDGSIFVALGAWAAWTAAASDPTLPLGAALAFAAWKLYDKRNKRNPGG